MDKRDEDFLKDLAWSEIWFPWRKKGILIRGSESRSAETIALFVSTVALVISGAATVGTWRQTDLMKQQLTAADRNTGVLRMMESVVKVCSTIKNGPIRTRKWDISRGPDGLPAKMPVVQGAVYRISLEQREAYGNILDDMKSNLTTVGLYRAFVEDNKIPLYSSLITEMDKTLDRAMDVVDDTRGDLNYVRLRQIGEDCVGTINNIVIDSVGADVIKKEIRKEDTIIDPLGRALLTPMPDIVEPDKP